MKRLNHSKVQHIKSNSLDSNSGSIIYVCDSLALYAPLENITEGFVN